MNMLIGMYHPKGVTSVNSDYKELKSRLLSQKKVLEERLLGPKSADLGESMRNEFSELSVVDNHPADIATEVFMRGMSVGDKVRDEAHLADIDEALHAIQSGSYGTCRRCEQSIAFERLSAVPTAMYCVTCQKDEEQEKKHLHRPVEENVLNPGFGAVFLDGEDQTAFDGEDAWQAVERYNRRQNQDDNYDQMELDDNEGIVDDMDAFSQSEYEAGLPPSPTYRP